MELSNDRQQKLHKIVDDMIDFIDRFEDATPKEKEFLRVLATDFDKFYKAIEEKHYRANTAEGIKIFNPSYNALMSNFVKTKLIFNNIISGLEKFITERFNKEHSQGEIKLLNSTQTISYLEVCLLSDQKSVKQYVKDFMENHIEEFRERHLEIFVSSCFSIYVNEKAA